MSAPETQADSQQLAIGWKSVAESRLDTILKRDEEILSLLKDNMRLREVLAGIQSRAEEGLKK